MILVSLMYNREELRFILNDKIIKYKDRKWNKWIQCIPRDEKFIMKIKMSRGRFPHFLIKMFKLSEKEQVEYDGAKDDEDLADIIINDGKKKGCKLRFKISLEDLKNKYIVALKTNNYLDIEKFEKIGVFMLGIESSKKFFFELKQQRVNPWINVDKLTPEIYKMVEESRIKDDS